jgi:hypothetical protein
VPVHDGLLLMLVRGVSLPGCGGVPRWAGLGDVALEDAGVQMAWEECEAGTGVFRKGLPSGVPPETIESISRTASPSSSRRTASRASDRLRGPDAPSGARRHVAGD